MVSCLLSTVRFGFELRLAAISTNMLASARSNTIKQMQFSGLLICISIFNALHKFSLVSPGV